MTPATPVVLCLHRHCAQHQHLVQSTTAPQSGHPHQKNGLIGRLCKQLIIRFKVWWQPLAAVGDLSGGTPSPIAKRPILIVCRADKVGGGWCGWKRSQTLTEVMYLM